MQKVIDSSFEFGNLDIFNEHSNYDSNYISFSKARNLIKDSSKELIRYNISDNQKAIDFINNISKRTTIYKNGKSYLRVKI